MQLKSKPCSAEENYGAMLKTLASLYLVNKENITTLYLIRHGKDELPNEANNYDQPLSPEGMSHAHLAGKRLSTYGITQLVSGSPLRTRQTADIIGSYTGLTNQVIDNLREVKPKSDFQSYARGLLEITTIWKEAQQSTRGRFTTLFWPDRPDVENGESARARAVKAIDAILTQYTGQRIALVSHLGLINAYVSEMLGLEKDGFFFIDSTGICVVYAYKEYRVLISLNDAAHIHS